MASQYIGVVLSPPNMPSGYPNGKVLAIINPDDDRELDNSWLLEIKYNNVNPSTLVRVPRGSYGATLSLADVAAIMDSLQ